MLDKINFTYKVADEQTELFTPHHTKYDVELSINGCNPFKTTYQCNSNWEVKKEDVLVAIMNDGIAYEYSNNLNDFMYEYEYKDKDKALKAYDACYNAYMWFETEWTREQYCQAYDELEGWF